MTLTWRRWLLPVILFSLAHAATVRAQSFGFAWWRDAQFQRDLSLTADQTARIEAVFQAAISQLRQKKQDLDQQEDELSRMISSNADETLVTRQVDKVETIRASMNKMRTLMLLHERQVLTPDQRARLNRLHEQWEKDHKTPPRGQNPK
jgi:Spy/CpxP family protein refolding chaperone